jgi:hypothetical protein
MIGSLESRVTPEIIDKISSNFDAIKSGKNGSKVYNSNPENLVFSLEELPRIIFKIGKSEPYLMEARYANIERARRVCRNFNLLKIPEAIVKEIKIKNKVYVLLIEEKQDINPDESHQESLYAQQGKRLTKAIMQLAEFILELGWGDVERRNAPIVNGETDEEGNCILTLIDLEDLNCKPELGLFGQPSVRRTGLVGLGNEEQAQAVIEFAKKKLTWTPELEELSHKALDKRQKEIQEYIQLQEYHFRKGIQKGDELINLDVKTLELPEDLKQPTQDLVEEINDLISKSKEEQGLKGRRNLRLNGLPFLEVLLDQGFNATKEQHRSLRIYNYSKMYLGDQKPRPVVFSNENTIMDLCLTKLVDCKAIFSKGINLDGHWTVQT